MKSQRKELPPVEKEVPLPVIKYHPNTRASRSRWVDYLLALAPGDSFVIEKGETQTVMIQAKRVGLYIVWRTCPDGSRVRVWVVPKEKIPEKPKRLWLKGEKRQVPHPKEKAPAELPPEPLPEPPHPAPESPVETVRPPVATSNEPDVSLL